MQSAASELQGTLLILLAMALSLVTFTIGVSYTVSRFVTETWRGRIIGLQDQITQMRESYKLTGDAYILRVTGLEKQIVSLEATIETMRTALREKDKQIESMGETIRQMQQTINKLQQALLVQQPPVVEAK